MTQQFDLFPDPQRAEYLHLTGDVLPQSARPDWPVRNHHCFQRIVLDTVCGGVWYEHLAKPAYKHMTQDQLQRAIALCRAILADEVDLAQLNRQSLQWRGKAR